jgi:hypothetical protein
MNATLIAAIVDVTRWITSEGHFSQTYTFDNGTSMVVSRNPMTRATWSGLCAALPIDKDGRQLDERAEDWLTAYDVAQKMDILASE